MVLHPSASHGLSATLTVSASRARAAASSLPGRRVLVSVTVGARRSAFSDGGIHGSLEDVLHPIQHGLFWFTGMNPPEPFAVYCSNEFPDDRFVTVRTEYARRLDTLFTATPVPFRSLTGGDYDHDMRLLPEVEAPGTKGLDLHVRDRV
ncbi:NAD(P)H-dependent oxidoreductase [Streptomyces sp. NPDC057684]|uniref:NAD(P)H-dependent oxidoreductase n=1 Tax=Streptomyces sp. NPDC057684 TaxID=3346211 RepID=UPI00367BE9CE